MNIRAILNGLPTAMNLRVCPQVHPRSSSVNYKFPWSYPFKSERCRSVRELQAASLRQLVLPQILPMSRPHPGYVAKNVARSLLTFSSVDLV